MRASVLSPAVAPAVLESAPLQRRTQTVQGRQARSIDTSPRQVAQARRAAEIIGAPVLPRLAGIIDHSPRLTAQAQRKAAIFGAPVQQQKASAHRTLPHAPEEDELHQRKAAPAAVAPAQATSTPNRTGLPHQLKAGVEALSGISLDGVKVHYNSSKPAQLHAQAYAQGSDIHIAPGREKHLPHEAWHVVQQAQGRVKPTMQMKGGVPVNDDAGLEREADVMGARAVAQGAGMRMMSNAQFGHPSSEVAQRTMSINKGQAGSKSAALPRGMKLTKEERSVYNLWSTDDQDRHFHDIDDLLRAVRRKASANVDGKAYFDQNKLPQNEGDSGGLGAMLSKFGSLKGLRELSAAVSSTPRVKRHNTSAWITGRIKNRDYAKIYVPINKIKSQHSIDGVAVNKTQERSEKIALWLKRNNESKSMGIDVLNELAGSTGSLKVGMSDTGDYITLDGVGRLEAIKAALRSASGEKAHPLTHVQVYAVKLSTDEFNQLNHTSNYFRDENGQQRNEPVHDLWSYTALPRAVMGAGLNFVKNKLIPKVGEWRSPVPDRRIEIK